MAAVTDHAGEAVRPGRFFYTPIYFQVVVAILLGVIVARCDDCLLATAGPN